MLLIGEYLCVFSRRSFARLASVPSQTLQCCARRLGVWRTNRESRARACSVGRHRNASASCGVSSMRCGRTAMRARTTRTTGHHNATSSESCVHSPSYESVQELSPFLRFSLRVFSTLTILFRVFWNDARQYYRSVGAHVAVCSFCLYVGIFTTVMLSCLVAVKKLFSHVKIVCG